MQTFLPYADFARSAEVLDDRRLGKQRVEGIQIVRALTVPAYAWKSHPAVLMWAGSEPALEAYLVAVCDEWARRGYDDTCRETIRADLAGAGFDGPRDQASLASTGELPVWLGDDALHRSHRAALLRKDAAFYRPRFDGEDLDDVGGYVWPVRSPKVLAAEEAKLARAVARAERAALAEQVAAARAAERTARAEAARRAARSRAARKAARTRAANARRAAAEARTVESAVRAAQRQLRVGRAG